VEIERLKKGGHKGPGGPGWGEKKGLRKKKSSSGGGHQLKKAHLDRTGEVLKVCLGLGGDLREEKEEKKTPCPISEEMWKNFEKKSLGPKNQKKKKSWAKQNRRKSEKSEGG